MATSNDELRRTVKPGDIVVSLNEIVNRLQSLVSPGVLDGLLSDIVANRRGEVRPGQVITASLMNQVLRQLESLEVRIATLEERTTNGSKLVLTNIVPSGILRVGQIVRLEGRNFGFTSKTVRVTIAGVPVTQFDTSYSNDNRLVFSIPSISVPAVRQEMTLRVSNGDQSAEKTITIMRPDTTQSGYVTVQYVRMSPNQIVPGATDPVWFEYKLIARIESPEMITITPTVAGVDNAAEWNSQLNVMTDQRQPLTSNRLNLPNASEKTFFVQLASVPSKPDNGKLSLKVTATSDRLLAASDVRVVSISEAVPVPNPNVTLEFVVVYPEGALSGDSISVITGSKIDLQLYLSFNEAGIYKLTSSTNDSNSWNSDPSEKIINVTTVPYSQVVNFIVEAMADDVPDGRIEIQITSEGSSMVNSYTYDLIR